MIRFRFPGFLILQFAPASYGQQQPPSLVQPTPQMHASGSVPPPANSWPAPVVSQSTTLVSPVQLTSQQTPATPTDPVSGFEKYFLVACIDAY